MRLTGTLAFARSLMTEDKVIYAPDITVNLDLEEEPFASKISDGREV